MKDPKKLRQVGVIASAHGVRGQVKIKSFLEDPEDLLSCGVLTDATGKRVFTLTRQGIKDKLLIASIEGVIDRNQAELLRSVILFAPPSLASVSDGDTWSYDELTELEARLASGAIYGKVLGVYNFGAGDIIELELADGKTEMLPFTDTYIGAVHPDKGYLIVTPPDYIVAGSPESDDMDVPDNTGD